METKLRRLWKNEYFQTTLAIIFVGLVVLSFWHGSKIILNTQYPALAVVSGSMCTPYGRACDGWTHPFSTTLHIGDLIIVQGVDPVDLSDDYPMSDIIVFRKPGLPDELIVHRIVLKEFDLEKSKFTFKTKGDGNGSNKWPNIPQESEYDHWDISEGNVVGKVVMRIPWIGHVVLFMHNSVGIPLIVIMTIILVFVEFVIPLFRKRNTQKTIIVSK